LNILEGEFGARGGKIALSRGENTGFQLIISRWVPASWKLLDVEMQYEVGTGVLKSGERKSAKVAYFYHDDTWDNQCWKV